MCYGWLRTIRSARMMRTNISEEQRELLIDLALIFLAFIEYPELDCAYWRFVGAVIEAALELNPMERADSTLRELIRAARQTLPSVRYFFYYTVCVLIIYTTSMLFKTLVLLAPSRLIWLLWPVSTPTTMARVWMMTYDPFCT